MPVLAEENNKSLCINFIPTVKGFPVPGKADFFFILCILSRISSLTDYTHSVFFIRYFVMLIEPTLYYSSSYELI